MTNTDTKKVITNSMLTTKDNPYNPFKQFEEWYAYDIGHGYNTSNYLARIAKIPDYATEEEESDAIEAAIDEIIFYNILGIYKKVSPDSFNESLA